MNILRRIQEQPLRVRKTILWLIIIILGTVFLFWWVNSFGQRIKKMQKTPFFASPQSGEQLRASGQ